jgi:hypothetical protein
VDPPTYWDIESDDCWALRGQITDNIEYMMRSEAEVMDPFELAAAARTTKLNLHLLVAVPGCNPRKSASSVLGIRTRHWDGLSLLLAKLKRPSQNGPVSLAKVRWEHIWEQYDELPYKQPCQTIGEDAAKAITDAMAKKVGDLPSFSGYAFQESHLLLSAMLTSASEVVGCDPAWEIQAGYSLQSNLGVVDVRGNADFVISLGDKCVCVMEAREAEPTGDSSEEEDDDEPKELRIMGNGLAQVVVAVETVNTHPHQRALGIVTSYRHWKFVKIEYEEIENKAVLATLLVEDDTLTESNYDLPDEQGVARIVGKIAAMLAG